MTTESRSLFVRLAPAAYRRLRLEKVAASRGGSAVFARAYWLYKRWIEDPHAGLVRAHPHLLRGGDVLDVGANIGYTTSLFARAVEPGRQVISFEPEEQNFARLSAVARKHDCVRPVRSAVGDHDGVCALKVNRHHPGDHQVVGGDSRGADDTVEVPMVTLDSYLSADGRDRPVAFIKIDVQGHEEAVCRGMGRLLDANPAVAVSFEYSGASSDPVIDFFSSRGFRLSVVHPFPTVVETHGGTCESRPDALWADSRSGRRSPAGLPSIALEGTQVAQEGTDNRRHGPGRLLPR